MGPHSVTMAPWFLEVLQCHNGLLSIPWCFSVSKHPLTSKRFQSVAVAHWFKELLQCDSCSLVSCVTMSPWFNGAPESHNGPLVPWGLIVSQWSPWLPSVTTDHWFHGDPTVPQQLLAAMGFHNVKMSPWFHEVLQCCSCPLVIWSLTTSQWTLVSLGPYCVTMVSLVLQCHNGPLIPCGSTVSQWPLGSTKFCSVTTIHLFHGAPQFHNGPFIPWVPTLPQWPLGSMNSDVSQWPLGSMGPHSVTMDSLVAQFHHGPLVIQYRAVSQWPLGNMRPDWTFGSIRQFRSTMFSLVS